MSSNTQKLAILRRRTDQDLVVLIQRELDRGLLSIVVAGSRNSPFFADAMQAHRTAAALWAKVSGAGQADRAQPAPSRTRSRPPPLPSRVRISVVWQQAF